MLATELSSGFSIRMHIDPVGGQHLIAPGETGNYFEDISMMQLPITRLPDHQDAIDLPHCDAPHEGSSFGTDSSLNPLAAEFRPGRAILSAYSEFIRDLHFLWANEAFAWEQESPSAHFLTILVSSLC